MEVADPLPPFFYTRTQALHAVLYMLESYTDLVGSSTINPMR